jgi:hypothetical protein
MLLRKIQSVSKLSSIDDAERCDSAQGAFPSASPMPSEAISRIA